MAFIIFDGVRLTGILFAGCFILFSSNIFELRAMLKQLNDESKYFGISINWNK